MLWYFHVRGLGAASGPLSKTTQCAWKSQPQRAEGLRTRGWILGACWNIAGVGDPRIGGGTSVAVNLRGKFHGVSCRRFTADPGSQTASTANGRWQRRDREDGSSGKCIRTWVINIMPAHCRHSGVPPPTTPAKRPPGRQCRHMVRPRSRRRPMGPAGSLSAITGAPATTSVGEGPIN
jgi:hypothetical protein